MNRPLVNQIRGLLLLQLALASCASPTNSNLRNIEGDLERIRTTDVLLVSDHTLPQHLNLSTGGANGEERLFIDPTITSLSDKLLAAGLKPYTLNVEDMTINGEITNRKDFDAAYAQYDEILSAAVNAGATIVAIHYDADLISAEDYGSDAAYASAEEEGRQYGYVGGIQLILDARATSDATLQLADIIIHRDQILQQLSAVGFRIRPGYDDEVRFQDNQTMHIAGNSEGGAFLLEIAPLDQAVRLFQTPDRIVAAIAQPLASLADTIRRFRAESVDQ